MTRINPFPILATLISCLLLAGVVPNATAESLPPVDVSMVTGAKVNESGLTTIEVSVESGSDDNSGAEGSPVKTLKKAFDLASVQLRDGISTRIAIEAGIYRETGISLNAAEIGGAAQDTPLVIEGTSVFGVDWRGSKVVTNWECVDVNKNLHCTPWITLAGDPDMGPDRSGQPSPDDRAPSDIAISWEPGAKGATLRWTPSDNPSVKGYLIYRTSSQPQTAVRDYKRLSTDALSAPSFQDVELPKGDQWFFYQVVPLLEDGKEGVLSRAAGISGNVQFIPNALGRRAELVFVDGQLLRQVNTRNELAVGTYCVDGSEPAKPHLLIQLFPRQNTANARIEVSGQNAFLPNLAVNAKNNLVIRRIRFQHAGVRAWNFGAFNISGGRNILIEDNEFSDNNSDGIHCGGMDDFTFRRNRCIANGGGGFAGTGRTNWLFEDNECTANGWRATTLGGETAWFHAGIKTGFGLRNAIFRNNRMTSNACIGFWLDTDMENVLIDGLVCTDNERDGMWWEAARGPGLVTRSRFERNSGYGLRIADAGGLVLDGNTVSDNSRAQICIALHWFEEQAGRPIKNRMTGETSFGGTSPNVWANNVIAALRPDQMIVAFEWGNLSSYQVFLNNLTASGNTYWHPSTQYAFMSPFAGSLFKLTLDQWSKITGQGKPQDTAALGTRWLQPTFIPSDVE